MFHFGEIHPAIIHFPIVLVSISVVFDILYGLKKVEIFQVIATWMIIIAALFLVPTAITGFLAKDFYNPEDPDLLRHQYMAIAAFLFITGYAVYRGHLHFSKKAISLSLSLLFGIISLSLINITAEFGGTVVRGKGLIFNTLREPGTPLPYDSAKKDP